MTEERRAIAERFGQIERLLHNLAFAQGLNPAQWSALRYLGTAADPARTVTSFARHHRTTKPAASKTVDALVRKALVRKVAVPGDRRAQRIDLTAKARRRLAADPLNHFFAALEGLDRHETTLLARALETVAGGIRARSESTARRGARRQNRA
jgi:DNA-binding MarR family transcriptional regulator